MNKNKIFGFYNAASIIAIAATALSLFSVFLVSKGYYIPSLICFQLALLALTFEKVLPVRLPSLTGKEGTFNLIIKSLASFFCFSAAPCVLLFIMGYSGVFDQLLYCIFLTSGAVFISDYLAASTTAQEPKKARSTILPFLVLAITLPLFYFLHILTNTVDGTSSFVDWILKIVLIASSVVQILRVAIPKFQRNIYLFIGVGEITILLACIIAAIAKS